MKCYGHTIPFLPECRKIEYFIGYFYALPELCHKIERVNFMTKNEKRFSDHIAENRSIAELGDYRNKGKGNDHGFAGKGVFEPACKLYLGTCKGAFCSPAKQIDGRKKNADGRFDNLEFKSGYGEITSIERDGSFGSVSFRNADLIIWAGDPLSDPAEALVIRKADLLAQVDILRLVPCTEFYARHTDPTAEKGTLVKGAYCNQLNFIRCDNAKNKAKVDARMRAIAIGTLAEYKAKAISK